MRLLLTVLACAISHLPIGAAKPLNPYPETGVLTASPGNTTYFVDPVGGNDSHDGRSSRQAWKTFARVNALRLAAGDTVIVAPGGHTITLKPSALGTAEKPVRIRFLPGLHEFTSTDAYRRPWFVSNTADNCFRPKPCAILIEDSQHVVVQGAGVKGKDRTTVMMSGPERMVKVINHQAEDIIYQGLAFDLKRPSVSEILVLETDATSAVVQVAQGSTYQFTENLTFQRLNVVPPPGNTFRFTPSVMDVFHFANCRGHVLIDSCTVSGAGDDGVNYHGIHLGIAAFTRENQLQLRFMQGQTYGFAPYTPGDEIAVIDHNTLREIPNNPRRNVTAVELMPADDERKNWLVTLDGPAPAFQPGDVADNLTWQADVTIRNNRFELASCRGILATSRGKILIEGNTINSTMPGVLIEDDANFWWESSCVRDLTIRNNTFLHCGIDIAPNAPKPNGPVHENIRIEGNTFIGEAIANHYRGKSPFITTHGVKGLSITGNRFAGDKASWMRVEKCEDVKQDGNEAFTPAKR